MKLMFSGGRWTPWWRCSLKIMRPTIFQIATQEQNREGVRGWSAGRWMEVLKGFWIETALRHIWKLDHPRIWVPWRCRVTKELVWISLLGTDSTCAQTVWHSRCLAVLIKGFSRWCDRSKKIYFSQQLCHYYHQVSRSTPEGADLNQDPWVPHEDRRDTIASSWVITTYDTIHGYERAGLPVSK